MPPAARISAAAVGVALSAAGAVMGLLLGGRNARTVRRQLFTHTPGLGARVVVVEDLPFHLADDGQAAARTCSALSRARF